MPALRVYLQTGRGAGVVQGGAQAVAVVEQDLVATGLDQYRRQARQVAIERGAGRASRIITAIGASGTGQPGVAEHDVPVSVEQVVEAQVHPGRNQDGAAGQGDLFRFQGLQGGQGKTAASGIAGDGQGSRVHALCQQGLIHSHGILDGGGAGMLRRQPVVRYDHAGIGEFCQVRGNRAVAFRAASHITTTVQIKHGALGIQRRIVPAGYVPQGSLMAGYIPGDQRGFGHDVQPAPLCLDAEAGVGHRFEQHCQGLAQGAGQQLLGAGLGPADSFNEGAHSHSNPGSVSGGGSRR